MVWGCVGLYGMVGVVESFESFVNVMWYRPEHNVFPFVRWFNNGVGQCILAAYCSYFWWIEVRDCEGAGEKWDLRECQTLERRLLLSGIVRRQWLGCLMACPVLWLSLNWYIRFMCRRNLRKEVCSAWNVVMWGVRMNLRPWIWRDICLWEM